MRSLSGASLTLGTLGLAATIGCSQVGMVQARRDFKAANAAYQQQDYKKAADLYEQTLKEDPTLSKAYFYLANSYDNQFKPSRKGERLIGVLTVGSMLVSWIGLYIWTCLSVDG